MVDSGFIDKKKSGYYVHDWEDKYSQLDKYRKMNDKDKKNTDKEKMDESNKKYKDLQKKLHPEIKDEIK